MSGLLLRQIRTELPVGIVWRAGVTRIDLTADEEGFEACDNDNKVDTNSYTNGCVLLFDAEAVF